ncbi:hypothetical protein [Alcaligenes endophyticus]|uniref:Uncharacterized protein n=1 Tax=Alcaligenes endophyticus TaxID=1929088 RepID=A0ABT8EKW2_9BURK|nr:hypothetical protein [Alcaligenes endophyticus]MCX5590703.1 hypothetical protein [Alcaligenes endophyticus]MDN4121933.1 hypothetical protein [Alcaligenes endophyticus]
MIDQPIQLFISQDGKAQLEVALNRDTVWLIQGQMATLFDTSTDNTYKKDPLPQTVSGHRRAANPPK